MKKPLFLLGASCLILAIVVGGVFAWQKGKNSKQVAVQDDVTPTNRLSEAPPVVSWPSAVDAEYKEVNPDVKTWKPRQELFYTVKYPTEWQWVEGDQKKTGYGAHILTNSTHLNVLDKIPDIVFFGDGIANRDNRELFIVFSGAPKDDYDPKLPTKQVLDNYSKDIIDGAADYNATCERKDSIVNVAVVKCKSTDNGQNLISYVAMNRTMAATFLARKNTFTLEEENLLEKIAQSINITGWPAQ